MNGSMLTQALLLVNLVGCLNNSGEGLDWPSVKSEIRAQFPSVAQISTEKLEEWLVTRTPLLVDARTTKEYSVSHLQNAVFAKSEMDFPEVGKDTLVVVYCSVGYRSSRLAEQLAEAGYTNVFNLEGSIFQWANEGRAVYRGSQRVDVVHPYDDHWGSLLNKELWSVETLSRSKP